MHDHSLFKVFIVLLISMVYPLPSHGEGTMNQKSETAIFAGGCFWCLQPTFDSTPGVTATVVGYTGGKTESPTYEQVSSGATGHREAIQITFLPDKVSYRELVEIFWTTIDPTQADGQFADIGHHYTTAIYVNSAAQRAAAEESKSTLAGSGKFKKPIVTVIEDAAPFYPAEEYHQKYYLKSKMHYQAYKVGSGRAGFIEENWGSEQKK